MNPGYYLLAASAVGAILVGAIIYTNVNEDGIKFWQALWEVVQVVGFFALVILTILGFAFGLDMVIP